MKPRKKMEEQFLVEKKKSDEKDAKEASASVEDEQIAHQKKMAEQFLVEKKKYDENEAKTKNEKSVGTQYYVVTVNILNVRSQPNKNSKRVTKVYKNQKALGLN